MDTSLNNQSNFFHNFLPNIIARLILFFLWSLVFGHVLGTNVWRNCCNIVTMVTVGKSLKLSLFKDEKRMRGNRLPIKSIQDMGDEKISFWSELSYLLQSVRSLRTFIHFLKYAIGIDFFFIFPFTVAGTFCAITVPFPSIFIRCIIYLNVSLSYVLLGIIIYVPAYITSLIRERTNQLHRMADRIKWTPIERIRINRTLGGMRYLISFSIFDLIPDIHKMMIVTVSDLCMILYIYA